MERFGLARLFEDQLGAPSSPVYWLLGVVCLLLLLGSCYVFLQAGRRYAEDRFHLRIARRYAALIGAFSALGAASVAFSVLSVPFLSKRLWLVIAVLGLAASAGHLVYFFRRRYARAQFAHREAERRRRPRPRPKAGGRKRRGRRQ